MKSMDFTKNFELNIIVVLFTWFQIAFSFSQRYLLM